MLGNGGPQGNMADVAALAETWNRLARDDALWAVLTDPTKTGRRWTIEDFLETGRREVSAVFRWLDDLGIDVALGQALDFGCGAGRLTQALGSRFSSVVGVDVSQEMITAALQLSPPSNCVFVNNSCDDLSAFSEDAFDFIYSNIVLQHMPPRLGDCYMQEFLRILRPGGTAVVGVAERGRPLSSSKRFRLYVRKLCSRTRVRLAIRARVNRTYRRRLPVEPTEGMQMHPFDESRVRGIVERYHGSIIDRRLTNSAELDFVGDLTFITDKPAGPWCGILYVIQRAV